MHKTQQETSSVLAWIGIGLVFLLAAVGSLLLIGIGGLDKAMLTVYLSTTIFILVIVGSMFRSSGIYRESAIVITSISLLLIEIGITLEMVDKTEKMNWQLACGFGGFVMSITGLLICATFVLIKQKELPVKLPITPLILGPGECDTHRSREHPGRDPAP